jgi:hypothetical protein
MYREVVDRKPPLVPWLYEACFAMAGPGGLWLVRLLAVAALGLTAMVTARLAARLLGAWAALPAGVLTVAASAALPAPDAMAATFEIFMLPSAAAALHCGVRGRWFAAGLAVAVAGLTKQVGAAPLLPLAFLAVRDRQRLRATAALTVGAAVLPLACALALGVRPFVFWVLLSSGSYAASPPGVGAVVSHAMGNALPLLSAFAPAAALACVTVRRNRRRQRTETVSDPTAMPRAAGASGGGRHRLPTARAASGADHSSGSCGPRTAVGPLLGLWLLASAVGVAVGFHFYGHYFLQLVPVLSLVALYAVDRAARATRARTALLAAGCALLVAAGWTIGAMRARPPEMGTSLAVAAAVSAESRPGEPVFVWGMHPEVYWLARRPPASRYLTAGLLTNFSGGGDVHRVGAAYAVPGAWRVLRREFAAAPPCVVADESAATPYRLADYPYLRDLLAHGYREVRVVDGVRLYRALTC